MRLVRDLPRGGSSGRMENGGAYFCCVNFFNVNVIALVNLLVLLMFVGHGKT
jgi:hypothetical protein